MSRIEASAQKLIGETDEAPPVLMGGALAVKEASPPPGIVGTVCKES